LSISFAGLWVGYAFVVIGLGISALTLRRLFLRRPLVRPVDGVGQWRRAHARRLVDAPELAPWPRSTTSSTSPLRLRSHGAAETRCQLAPGLEFSKLQEISPAATDGNLGAHIETLSKAGYVAVDKAFVGQEAADHGDRHGGRPRRLCPPCRDAGRRIIAASG